MTIDVKCSPLLRANQEVLIVLVGIQQMPDELINIDTYAAVGYANFPIDDSFPHRIGDDADSQWSGREYTHHRAIAAQRVLDSHKVVPKASPSQ